MAQQEVSIDLENNTLFAHSDADKEIIVHPKVQKHLSVPLIEQRSDEWYALRKQRLTASDVATALGFNPYQTRHELVYKKAGGNDTFKGNEATRWGQKWEDVAIKKYELLYKVHVAEFGLMPHPDIDYLAGSPDGIVKENATLIEVKCPMKRKIIPGVVPDYYIPQVQVCMECMDLDECHFIQFIPANEKTGVQEVLDITIVKRDKEWFTHYEPVMRLFWQEVLHYRNIGVQNHPSYIKKEKAIQAKAEKANKEVQNKGVYMFSDSDEDPKKE